MGPTVREGGRYSLSVGALFFRRLLTIVWLSAVLTVCGGLHATWFVLSTVLPEIVQNLTYPPVAICTGIYAILHPFWWFLTQISSYKPLFNPHLPYLPPESTTKNCPQYKMDILLDSWLVFTGI